MRNVFLNRVEQDAPFEVGPRRDRHLPRGEGTVYEILLRSNGDRFKSSVIHERYEAQTNG